MISKSKPTVFLTPGVFHKPSVFSALVSALENEDYPALPSATPSLNPPNAFDTSL